MKLKLLFFMGLLTVFCNTVYGQLPNPNLPPEFTTFPASRIECPKYVAANTTFSVTDSNTPAPFLIVTAVASGAQTVELSTIRQDVTGLLRAIDVTPTAPFVGGIVTITLTLTDVAPPGTPISVITTFTVNFNDSTPPTINPITLPNIDVNIDSTIDSASPCTYTVPDFTNLISANDTCGDVTITQSPTAGTPLPATHNGIQTVTLTATDEYTNATTVSFDITFKDVSNPIVVTKNHTAELNSSGTFSYSVSDFADSVTDNCGISLQEIVDLGPFDCSALGDRTVILKVTDTAGNITEEEATLTVVDIIDPTIICPANVTVDTDFSECFASGVAIGTATPADNCSATVSGSRSDSLPLTDPYPTGVTTITWTATDTSGNTATCDQTVTVEDNESPTVITQDITVELDSTGNVSIVASQINNGSNDNCTADADLTLALDITTFDCTDLGANTVTLTVTDSEGNSGNATAIVTVEDNEDPVIATSGLVEIGTDPGVCVGTTTITPATATDNCTVGSPTWVRSDGALNLNDPFAKGDTTITWSVTDLGGNTVTDSQTVTVTDDEDPVISSPMVGGFNALIAVDNDPGTCQYETAQLLSNPLIAPTATDNCPVGLIVVSVSPEFVDVSAGPDHPTELITWTVTDDNGNTATATQQILVRDLVSPIMRTKDISRNFDANGQVVITVEDIDDGSTDNSGEDCFDKYVVDNIIDCNEVGVHDVALFGKDRWGNQHYSIAKVTVSDNTAPTFVEATLPVIDLNTNAGCTWVGVLPIPATADNCSVVSVTNDAPAAFPVGDTTVTWTVEDAAANTSTITQLVSVLDVEKPIAIAKVGVVVELDNSGVATLLPEEIDNGSTDNCTIASIVVSPDSFDCTTVGNQVVTLTVTDDSGNESSVDTVVTVVDNIAPEVVTQDFDAILSTSGTVTVTDSDVVVSATDACTIKSIVITPNTFTCANLGANDVTVTVTDANNNVTTNNVVVTVIDDILPTITVTNVEVDTNSGCIWTGALGTPVTADNCSIVSVTSDKAIDFAYPIGDTNVVWTVTDAAGNTATATQVVTVNDSELPIAKANDFTVVLDATGSVTITATEVDNFSTDNCGIATVKIGASLSDDLSFDCDNVGENTVLLTITDNSGNISTANATITVVDTIIPVIASVTPITEVNSTGICGANIVITAPIATDICTPSIVAVGTRSDALALTDAFPLGTTFITWNAIDANGNVALPVIQTVTVTDTEKPTITVTDITVDANAGCIWTGTLGLPVTNDNCTVASVTSDKAADFAYPVGLTTVIWTVTDLAGNTQTATQAVTVRDTEKPIAKASDITIKLSSNVGAGSASIVVADIDNGSTDNCGIKSLVISKDSFDCDNVGKNTVILTVTDNSDNVSTANAIVTVVDDVLPVIAPVTAIAVNNTTGKCGADLAVTPSATATDNCTVGLPIGTRSDAKALNATYPLGRTIITWNVTDENGNIALSVIQTVDVTDNQIPVITTNGNKTAFADLGGCSAVVSVSATAADNCGVGSPTWVRSDAKPLSAAYPVGVTTITWNVTDVNGNPATPVTQTVTVTDNQIPVITANGNKNLVSDFGQCGANVVVSATATDNCSVGTPIPTRSDNAAIDALYPVGTTTITWNVTDVNVNAAIPVSQTVIVRDLQIPVINGTVVSIDSNTDGNACGATVTVTAPTATDNCSVTAPVVGTRSDNLPLTALYPIGSTTITWRVSDIYANVAVPTTTTVKVKDMVLPTVRTKNISVQLNVGGFATIVAAQINDGSTDNCAIASYSLDKVSFNCSNVGANTVTLTVIDIHGNENSATAIVTISEPVKPIARALTSVTLQLSSVGTVSVIPADLNNGSTDNCGIVSYALSRSNFTCSDVGINTIVSLTATDASGNVSDPVQVTVIVQDKLAPVVVTQAYTAILNSFGTVTIASANVNNGSNDNCTVAANLTYSISKSTFTCDNVGENIITLTVTDANGNSAQAFATVNVVDDIAPSVITKNKELVLVGDSVSIEPEDVLVSATDACGVDVTSYKVEPNTFDIDDVLAGQVIVTVFVTDVNGNVGSSPATITFPRVPAVANEVITPNNDGTNDVWKIENITNHPDSVVKVYNTWGSLVFSAKNYQNNWDGKINGNDVTLPDGGSYYYQIDLDGNGTVEEQGWLYITRQ